MTPSVTEPAQIVDLYLKALETGDFERLRACLSDTFTYRGTTIQSDDPDQFIARIWRIGQILNRIEVRKTFVDGADVCSILNFHVQVDIPKSIPVVQWSVVREGKIAAIEFIFDATDYTAMFVNESPEFVQESIQTPSLR